MIMMIMMITIMMINDDNDDDDNYDNNDNNDYDDGDIKNDILIQIITNYHLCRYISNIYIHYLKYFSSHTLKRS
jgi:hypothetical protein